MHNITVDKVEVLTCIPGVGKNISKHFYDIGIYKVSDLKSQNPEWLYEQSNKQAGTVHDRCLLYVYRCAVYYAETNKENLDKEKLKWWYWKDKK